MQNRRKSSKTKQPSGPGRLTFAWLGLIATLGALALLIHTIGNPNADQTIIALNVKPEPERLARPSAVERRQTPPPQQSNTAAIAPSQQPVTPLAPPGGKVITLPVSEAPSQPSATAAAQAERLQIMQDSTAKVIRLDDLPTASATKTSAIRPFGSAPPPPNPSLFTDTKDGPYPQIANNGRRAASYYARKFKDPADRPRIAIIIGGLGLSPTLTNQAINELPPEITLAFAPYSKNLQSWANQAREAGHELMVELPMEAAGTGSSRLGPAGLLSARSPLQNQKRLDWLLSRFAGYFGVTNYLGNKLSTDKAAFAPVLEQIKVSGVAFVADNEINPALSLSGASDLRTDFLVGAKPGSIIANLATAEKIAKKNHHVLIKVYPTAQSLAEITRWAESLKTKGIVLAPASSLILSDKT